LRLSNRLLAIVIVTLGLSLVAISCAEGKGVSASLVPSPEEIVRGEQFEIKVWVEPVERGVSAGEISVSFDPEAMQTVNIEPGELLGEDPLLGISNIDNDFGTIRYSLARIGETKAPTQAAAFAVISFQVLESAPTGDYQLTLTAIGLANEDFEDITGVKVEGASIKISP